MDEARTDLVAGKLGGKLYRLQSDNYSYNLLENKDMNVKVPDPYKAPNLHSQKHRPFFSIIIPCYNDGRYKDGEYLDRLLSSIIKQSMPKEDVEIILADDCSPVHFDDVINKYNHQLNMKYVKTDYNFGPGNTRAKGLTIATGKWLTFADHDDIYYPDGLRKIYNAIHQNHEECFIFSDFTGGTGGNSNRIYECNLNWCHAKFYNKDNLWDKFGIHFIHDLKTHEDIAICTQLNCITYSGKNIPPFSYLHDVVYQWTQNPSSVSNHSYKIDGDDTEREFLEANFNDYIQSTGYIYLHAYDKGIMDQAYALKVCIEVICYMYFYINEFMFTLPDKYYKKNLEYAGTYVKDMKKRFKITNKKIYDIVAYREAHMYYDIFKKASVGVGRFIPQLTFMDWLNTISPELILS